MKTITYIPETHLFMRMTLVAILLLGALSEVHAGADGKMYSGWMCRPERSATALYLRYNAFGGIINTSTTNSLNVLCPILRDSVYSGNDSDKYYKGIAHASVFYSDQHPSKQVTCSITSNFGSDGGRRAINYGRSPIARKVSSVFHIYGPQHIGNYVTLAQGYYAMRCNLPPQTKYGVSVLRGFYVQEIND